MPECGASRPPSRSSLSRRSSSTAVAIDVEDHRPVDSPRPEEVTVQRVRQPLRRDGRARGAQRLRRNLAAVERHTSARALLVLAAEQVTVEYLEVERGRGLGGVLEEIDRASADGVSLRERFRRAFEAAVRARGGR